MNDDRIDEFAAEWIDNQVSDLNDAEWKRLSWLGVGLGILFGFGLALALVAIAV